jgi:hypothetical protein
MKPTVVAHLFAVTSNKFIAGVTGDNSSLVMFYIFITGVFVTGDKFIAGIN